MKKILILTLLLMMSLAIFTFLPARAEDNTNINVQVKSIVIDTNIDSSNFLEKMLTSLNLIKK